MGDRPGNLTLSVIWCEPREVKLREAGGRRRLLDVEVVLDGHGHMYLGRGWDKFAREHGVQLGHFLVFSYDGDAVLTAKRQGVRRNHVP